MGDYRVISGVTQALALSVQRAISSEQSPVSHSLVTTNRPDVPEKGDQPRVNIYLFHVQPNATLRNYDLPTMMEDNYIKKPTIALDLYYLFSFYGSDQRNKLESQLLMGLTMGAMHARPFIEPEELAAILADKPDDGVEYHQVSLAVETMSVHELSRLWQTFPQVPLVLSTAYRATTILISEDIGLHPAPPVIDRDFTILRGDIEDNVPPPSIDKTTETPRLARFRQAVSSGFNSFRGRQ